MKDHRKDKWRYAGTAGKREVVRSADRAPAAARRSSGVVRRSADTGERRPAKRALGSLGDLLVLAAIAVVAGGFLALLGKQAWPLAMLLLFVVVFYLWRVLK